MSKHKRLLETQRARKARLEKKIRSAEKSRKYLQDCRDWEEQRVIQMERKFKNRLFWLKAKKVFWFCFWMWILAIVIWVVNFYVKFCR